MRRRVFACQSVVLAFVLAAACFTGIIFAADDQKQTDRNAVLNHLNAIITWYRDAAANVAPGELPSDAIFQQNVRTFAAQAVQLAFEAAHAESFRCWEKRPRPASDNGRTRRTGPLPGAIAGIVNAWRTIQSKLDALNKAASLNVWSQEERRGSRNETRWAKPDQLSIKPCSTRCKKCRSSSS